MVTILIAAFVSLVFLYSLVSQRLERTALTAPTVFTAAGMLLFMGWFGPRGLASIVLGVVYLQQEAHLPGESTIRVAVMVTVLVSIFTHGLSAAPGIGLYARQIAALDAGAPEHQGVEERLPADVH